jgi:hypothetical protein
MAIAEIKSSLIVQYNKRKIPGNVFINSELTILQEKQCCIWISKMCMPTKRFHFMDFNINNKKSHVLLCILLSGDIATNPGPTNLPSSSNLCRSFSVFYQNVRSIKSTYWDNTCNSKERKLSCFHDIVLANQFDVIALTEIWLDSSISNHELLPTGYRILRRDRENKRGGGSTCS